MIVLYVESKACHTTHCTTNGIFDTCLCWRETSASISTVQTVQDTHMFCELTTNTKYKFSYFTDVFLIPSDHMYHNSAVNDSPTKLKHPHTKNPHYSRFCSTHYTKKHSRSCLSVRYINSSTLVLWKSYHQLSTAWSSNKKLDCEVSHRADDGELPGARKKTFLAVWHKLGLLLLSAGS